jgi:hypothetical protein
MLEQMSSDLDETVRMVLQQRAIEHYLGPTGVVTIPYGSAEIRVETRVAAGQSIVSVTADVLSEIGTDEQLELPVLRAMNERNRSAPFGRFSYDLERGTIVAEYEILAGSMQDEELMNAVTAVARLADDHDDVLQSELGVGLRASDRLGREPVHQGF